MVSFHTLRLAAVALSVGATTAHAQAGLTSNIATVTLNATKVASITVAHNIVGPLNATLVDNLPNNFASPIAITTTWDINPSASSLTLVAYFSSTNAMTNGTDILVSSLMKGRMTTGTPVAYTAFTQNAVGGVGTAGASLSLFTVNITGVNKKSTRTDNLDMQVDLTGQAPITAGTYTGTLNLRAVTQ